MKRHEFSPVRGRVLFLLGLWAIVILGISPALWSKNVPRTDVSAGNEGDEGARNCYSCHYCPKPTLKNPCLYECPRHRKKPGKDLKTSPDIGPDIVILDELENLYEPTVFNHKRHARMAEMANGCLECHHYSPSGEYPACKTCHSKGITCEFVTQVGLKGAYHRQCIRCHSNWSKSTDCEICHVLKTGGKTTPKTTRHLKHFPLVTPPAEKIYTTSFLGYSTVFFNHAAHSKDFDIQCQRCHHGSGCLPCHSQTQGELPSGPTPKAVGCLDCHETTECTTCHVTSDKNATFNHDATDFPLKPYHSNVGCRQCHTNQKRHHTAPILCSKCHTRWTPENFSHKVTGLVLDENHRDLDCAECHPRNIYVHKPSCDNCHDADIRYPENLPGTRTGNRKP